MSTAEPLVRHHIERAVATITLDSPANRNALSVDLVRQLHDALDAAEQGNVRVIVLTNSGTVFCAGADLAERERGIIDSAPLVRAFQRLSDNLAPTIAVPRGAVRAGGVGLMAACDLAIVEPTATFAFTEVRLGLIPAMIAVPLLRRVARRDLIGPFLTGEQFDAEHARQIGLVNQIADDLDAALGQVISGILLGSPAAVQASKALLERVSQVPRDQAYAEMMALSDQFFGSDDGREGMAARREKRPARWVTRT